MRVSEALNTVRKVVDFVRYHRLAKGDRLPSERELSERFGVARGAIREAFAILDVLRFTERRPNSGVYLRADLSESSIDTMVVQADIGIPLDEQEVADLFEARRLIEIQALALACQRRDDKDLARLRKVLASTEAKIARGESMAAEDMEFHLAMIAAAHNNILVRVVTPFYLISGKRRDVYFADAAHCRRSHADHVEIVEAIAAKDRDRALAVIERHLATVNTFWRESLVVPAGDAQPAG
jgi:DNA-binding FadR family transcriptional regulator